MAGSSLQNFIAAHRAKLDQEKQYLKQGNRMKLRRWASFRIVLNLLFKYTTFISMHSINYYYKQTATVHE